MSWKPEVIADGTGQWVGNALRFASKEEAEANVYDLSLHWFAVQATRVVESDDPVNYRWVDGRLEAVGKATKLIERWKDDPNFKDVTAERLGTT